MQKGNQTVRNCPRQQHALTLQTTPKESAAQTKTALNMFDNYFRDIARRSSTTVVTDHRCSTTAPVFSVVLSPHLNRVRRCSLNGLNHAADLSNAYGVATAPAALLIVSQVMMLSLYSVVPLKLPLISR